MERFSKKRIIGGVSVLAVLIAAYPVYVKFIKTSSSSSESMIRATPIEEEEADHLSTPSKPPKAKPQGRRGKNKEKSDRSLQTKTGVQQKKDNSDISQKTGNERSDTPKQRETSVPPIITRHETTATLGSRSDSTTLTAEKANSDSVPITESLKVTGHPLLETTNVSTDLPASIPKNPITPNSVKDAAPSNNEISGNSGPGPINKTQETLQGENNIQDPPVLEKPENQVQMLVSLKVNKSKLGTEESKDVPFHPKPLSHLVDLALRKNQLLSLLCDLFSNIFLHMHLCRDLKEAYKKLETLYDSKNLTLGSIQCGLLDVAQLVLNSTLKERTEVIEYAACILFPIYAFLPEEEFKSVSSLFLDSGLKEGEEELLLQTMLLANDVLLKKTRKSDSNSLISLLLNTTNHRATNHYEHLFKPITLAVHKVSFIQFVRENVARYFADGPKPPKPNVFIYASLAATTVIADWKEETFMQEGIKTPKELAMFLLRKVAYSFNRNLNHTGRYDGELGFMAALCVLPLVSSTAEDLEEVIVTVLDPREHWSVLIVDGLKLLLDVLYDASSLQLPLKRQDYSVGVEYCTARRVIDDFFSVLESVKIDKKTGLLTADIWEASRGSANSIGYFKLLIKASRYSDEVQSCERFKSDFEASDFGGCTIKVSDQMYALITEIFQ